MSDYVSVIPAMRKGVSLALHALVVKMVAVSIVMRMEWIIKERKSEGDKNKLFRNKTLRKLITAGRMNVVKILGMTKCEALRNWAPTPVIELRLHKMARE